MKERPILFSAPMVRAILAGTKTQTRRVVKPQPKGFWDEPNNCLAGGVLQCIIHDPKAGNVGQVRDHYIRCPYGQPGDRIWVREKWRATGGGQRVVNGVLCDSPIDRSQIVFAADATPDDNGPWRPSIHMPRWASRLLLEVVSVRAERVQDITLVDAVAEGAMPGDETTHDIRHFVDLWLSINSLGSWIANPWVWVVEFRRVQP